MTMNDPAITVRTAVWWGGSEGAARVGLDSRTPLQRRRREFAWSKPRIWTAGWVRIHASTMVQQHMPVSMDRGLYAYSPTLSFGPWAGLEFV